MTTCDGCVFADWKRTKSGGLHPDKSGRCLRLDVYPLDMRVPASFYWSREAAPKPLGGTIERGEPHRDKCVFKTAEDNKLAKIRLFGGAP